LGPSGIPAGTGGSRPAPSVNRYAAASRASASVSPSAGMAEPGEIAWGSRSQATMSSGVLGSRPPT